MTQLGFDFRISSLSGTPAIGTLPAAPPTGNVYTYTLQAIGSALTPLSDILALNASVLRGSLFDAWQASADYRFTPIALLELEPTLKYYRQTDPQNVRITRWVPGVRIVYRLRERFSLEGEYSLEKTHTAGPLIDDELSRHFFYFGWRWEF